jgi:hypothetical protein
VADFNSLLKRIVMPKLKKSGFFKKIIKLARTSVATT